MYSARLFGYDLGAARFIGAALFSVVIGLIMATIYRQEEREKVMQTLETFEENLPDIQFDEKVFDFGTVYEGATVIHIYKFKNIGQGVLKIKNIRSSCGCTAVSLTSKEIEPGGTGEIKATFNSKNFKVRITKKIYVHSNDPNEPIVTLEITGIVKVDVEVNPAMIDFGEIYEGESAYQKLTVHPEALEKLKVKGLEISSKEFALNKSKYSEGDKEGVENYCNFESHCSSR